MSNFPPEIRFDFPLPDSNSGIVIGNGNLGILVWGDEFLCLTIARAGFDEDSGANQRQLEITRSAVCAWLEAGGENSWRELLANSAEQAYSIGSAHLELRFDSDTRPLNGTLQNDGILQIAFSDGRVVTLECAMDEELAWLEGASDAQWKLRSAERDNDQEPLEIEIIDGCGLIWERAEGDSLALMVRKREQTLFLATAVGETEEAAKAAVTRARYKPDINPIYYWKQYWRTAPRVVWPHAQLQNFWNIALLRQAQLEAIEAATPTRANSTTDYSAS